MGNGRKVTWVRKAMSFPHKTMIYKGQFFGELHRSLDSTTVMHFRSSKGSKLQEHRKFYDIWLSVPAATEKKGC